MKKPKTDDECWLGPSVKRENYLQMSNKEQEAYHAALLKSEIAIRGYVAVDTPTDKHAADLVAFRPENPSRTALWIQLKSRLTIDKRYTDKDLYIAFPEKPGNAGTDWFIYPHDDFVDFCNEEGKWVTNEWCWGVHGSYTSISIPKWALIWLEQWRIPKRN